MTSGVYQILNTVNGKCYIGSSNRIEQRWRVHRNTLISGTHHSKKLMRSVLKHGISAFKFSVVEECNSEDNITRELFWIDVKDSVHTGYNSRTMPGSNLGLRHSADTKAEMSRTRKGRRWTEEAKAKLSASKKGVPKTTAQVEAMSARMKGRTQSPELIAKRVAPLRGVEQTQERVTRRVEATRVTKAANKAKRGAQSDTPVPPPVTLLDHLTR